MAIPATNLQPPCPRLCFDGFELDEVDARLTRQGRSVAIAPRPFAVLCALARKRGHLVTKSDLLDAVWGHRFVTDSVLKTAISDVRAALQDDAKQPRYVETVSGRGYRFMIPAVGAAGQSSSGVERDDDRGPGYPASTALMAMCRGDAALANLIRTVAATLEREQLATAH